MSSDYGETWTAPQLIYAHEAEDEVPKVRLRGRVALQLVCVAVSQQFVTVRRMQIEFRQTCHSWPSLVSPQVVGHRMLVAKDGTWYLPGEVLGCCSVYIVACLLVWPANASQDTGCCARKCCCAAVHAITLPPTLPVAVHREPAESWHTFSGSTFHPLSEAPEQQLQLKPPEGAAPQASAASVGTTAWHQCFGILRGSAARTLCSAAHVCLFCLRLPPRPLPVLARCRA